MASRADFVSKTFASRCKLTLGPAPADGLIAAEYTAQLNAPQNEDLFSKAEQNELFFRAIDLGDRGGRSTAIDVLSSTTTMEVGIGPAEAEPSVPVRRSSDGFRLTCYEAAGAYAHFRSLGGTYVHILKSIDENCAFVDRH
jgi:hypothetical protein